MRPLRPSGRKEFRGAAKGLSRLLTGRGTIVTSPLARARETAEMLQEAWKGTHRLMEWESLEPERGTAELFRKARSVPGGGDLVLVGHEPQLSRFIGYCIFGEELSAVRFSKGGAVAVDFPGRTEPGGARILWAFTRNHARSLRRTVGSRSKEE